MIFRSTGKTCFIYGRFAVEWRHTILMLMISPISFAIYDKPLGTFSSTIFLPKALCYLGHLIMWTILNMP